MSTLLVTKWPICDKLANLLLKVSFHYEILGVVLNILN